jgi:hypothetical protein
MPQPYTYHPYGNKKAGTTTVYKYTHKELMDAWEDTAGQGNSQARAHGTWCVLIPCTEKEAIVYSARFCRRFNIPSCCYYEGKILSMYCGDAGSGAEELLRDISDLRFTYVDEDGPLFADESGVDK